MEIQSNHYYAKNQYGEILFKIELSNIEAFPWLSFACSLDIDFNKYPGIKKAIEELCSPETTAEEKAMLLHKVMLLIKRIEGVDALYYRRKDEPELKRGISKSLEHIFCQDDFAEFVPFSNSHNQYFFRILKRKLAMPAQLAKMVQVERSSIEDLIKGHEKLENEYVNTYSADAAFFMTVLKDGRFSYEVYFMMAREVRLIFFAEI